MRINWRATLVCGFTICAIVSAGAGVLGSRSYGQDLTPAGALVLPTVSGHQMLPLFVSGRIATSLWAHAEQQKPPAKAKKQPQKPKELTIRNVTKERIK